MEQEHSPYAGNEVGVGPQRDLNTTIQGRPEHDTKMDSAYNIGLGLQGAPKALNITKTVISENFWTKL